MLGMFFLGDMYGLGFAAAAAEVSPFSGGFKVALNVVLTFTVFPFRFMTNGTSLFASCTVTFLVSWRNLLVILVYHLLGLLLLKPFLPLTAHFSPSEVILIVSFRV